MKDIQFLAHEPLLAKFREHKVWIKRIAKKTYKDEQSEVKRLRGLKPVIRLDHIIKERYPTFVDALRDLDDALTMVFLFARMPVETDRFKEGRVDKARRLSVEFQRWVMREKTLRKVFVSVKGVYYQAEIRGQTVTWIVPHPFPQHIPTEVDFKIMITFLQFYQALLGFVNYKLYTDSGLAYPPELSMELLNQGADLASIVVETKQQKEARLAMAEKTAPALTADVKARIASLNKVMANIKVQDEADVATDALAEKEDVDMANGSDEDIDEETEAAFNTSTSAGSPTSLFSKHAFFISRECPFNALHFSLASFGARLISWDPALSPNAPLPESSPSITIHIVDRPSLPTMHLGRIYVQPQWVFDSINRGTLLDTSLYAVGKIPPAHLSPFVEYKEGDYVPEEEEYFKSAAAAQPVEFDGTRGVDNVGDHDSDDDGIASSDNEDDVEEAHGSSDAEDEMSDQERYQREIDAEAQGKRTKIRSTPAKKGLNVAEKEEADRKKMAMMMMSKKNRSLYTAMQRGIKHRSQEVEQLKKKKAKIVEETSTKKKARKA